MSLLSCADSALRSQATAICYNLNMENKIRAAKRAFDSGDFEAGFLYYRLLRRAEMVEFIDSNDLRAVTRDDQYFSVVEGRLETRAPTSKSVYLLPWLYHLLILGYYPDIDSQYKFVVAHASDTIKKIIKTYPDLTSSPMLQDLTLEILEKDLINETGVNNQISAMLAVLERITNQTILHRVAQFKCNTDYMQQSLLSSLYNYHGVLELIQDQLNIGGYREAENALFTLAKAAEHLDIDFDADYWVEVALEFIEAEDDDQTYDGGNQVASATYVLQKLMVHRNISESLEEEIIDIMLRIVHRTGPGDRINVTRFDFQAANKLLAAIGYAEILPHLQYILAGLTHPDDIPPAGGFASSMGRGATIRAYSLLERAITELEASS